jgi:hypothetical protein
MGKYVNKMYSKAHQYREILKIVPFFLSWCTKLWERIYKNKQGAKSNMLSTSIATPIDHGWVIGSFLLYGSVEASLPVPRQKFSYLLCWIWNSELAVLNLELQMLPCLSPCIRIRLTHQLLENLIFTIHILWNIPVTKTIWENSGLRLDNRVRTVFQIFRSKNRFLLLMTGIFLWIFGFVSYELVQRCRPNSKCISHCPINSPCLYMVHELYPTPRKKL